MTKTTTNQIPDGWKEVTLGGVLTIHYGKGLPQTKRTNGYAPVYGSSGITGWHNEPLINSRGIIIGRKGTIGSVYKSDVPFYPIDTVYYLTEADTMCDFVFLYYFLINFGLSEMNSDSAVPGLNRNNLYSRNTLLPPLPEQKAIANVLSSLDDKIELLRKQNETLEAIAQAIFKEWFVNFNFPDKNGKPYKDAGGKMVDSELGKIPEGWRVGRLSEIADFLNGLALQKYPPESDQEYLPVIKIRELKQGISPQTDRASTKLDSKYIIQNGDVLFSWSGSLDIVVWKYGKGALNQHLFKVSSDKYPKWFYFYWIKHHLADFQQIASTKATTMGHIQRHHLDDAKVVIPNDNILENANHLFTPNLEKIILNNQQINTLTQLRDRLLPKLMSGQVRVNK